jgi:hypothetical protein
MPSRPKHLRRPYTRRLPKALRKTLKQRPALSKRGAAAARKRKE